MKRPVSARLAGWFVLTLPILFSAIALAGTIRRPAAGVEVRAKSAPKMTSAPRTLRASRPNAVSTARSHARRQAARSQVTPVAAAAAVSASQSRPAGAVEAGLIVGVDPETGELGLPTPDQRARLEALARSRRESASRPVAVRHPDGSLSIDVRGRMREFTFVRTRADGKLVYGCLDTPAAVRRALDPVTPAPAAPEER